MRKGLWANRCPAAFVCVILTTLFVFGNNTCSNAGNTAVSETSEVHLSFDDRYWFPCEISSIETLTVSSFQTGSQMPDLHVLTPQTDDLCKVVVTGCGSARVTLVDGSQYRVETTPAPIALILVAGQSNGEGRPSDAQLTEKYMEEQVRCPEGTAYGSYGPSDEYGQNMYREIAWYEDTEQIGALSVDNAERFLPVSLSDNTKNDRYCKTNRLTDAEAAGGKSGFDAAFCYKWWKLTGEKVWIINAAHHGSSIESWDPGASDPENYDEAVAMYQGAERILSAELSAGHYRLSHKGILWNQGESNHAAKAKEYVKALSRVIDGFWSDLAGSGIENMGREPDFFGIMMVRSGKAKPGTRKDYVLTGPRRAQYYMSLSADYPQVFLASQVREEWSTDEEVYRYFSDKYGTEEAFQKAYPTIGDNLIMPSTVGEMRKNIHYSQLANNEIGLDAAENLCYSLGYAEKPEIDEITITIVTNDGLTDRSETCIDKKERNWIPMAVKVFPTWLTKEAAVTVTGSSYYDSGALWLRNDGSTEVTVIVRGIRKTMLVE